MRLAALALAGCWTSTPALPRSTECAIRERLVETTDHAVLSLHALPFAKLDGPFVRIDAVVAGGEARAEIETEQVTLHGELALDQLSVRPKDVALRDGWLEVSHGIARAALDNMLRVEVDLPEGLQPKWTSIDVPCDALTFTERKQTALDEDVTLTPGTSATLYREPGAKPIGQWTAPRKEPDVPYEYLEAAILERKDGYLRIRIQGRNAVVAWISASAVEEVSRDVYGGLVGDEDGEPPRKVQCSRAQPIYVRVDNRVERVGTTKDFQTFTIRAVRGHEIQIDLGSPLAPFIDRRESNCKGAP